MVIVTNKDDGKIINFAFSYGADYYLLKTTYIDYNSVVNEARKCEAIEKIKSGIGGI